MFRQFHHKTVTALVAAAIAAFGVAGVAVAQSGGTSQSAPPAATAPDGDTLQQGDQTTPDTGPGAATEQSGAESSEAPGSEAAGSEVPGNDGPGGHADEPGNPSADHQFQGQE